MSCTTTSVRHDTKSTKFNRVVCARYDTYVVDFLRKKHISYECVMKVSQNADCFG